jgi:putative transposase
LACSGCEEPFAHKAGVGRWITVYNHHRPHTAHGGQPPAVVYFNHIETDHQVQAGA